MRLDNEPKGRDKIPASSFLELILPQGGLSKFLPSSVFRGAFGQQQLRYKHPND
jgi:hypothetical protein